MATFKRRPDGRHAISASIIRLKANERMQVICLNRDLTGADVHYTFRTEPCRADANGVGCLLCDDGKSYRWEGYFLGWSPSNNVTAIYAVSEGNSATFQSYFEREGNLRGAMVTMSRGSRANEKVKIGIMKGQMALNMLPSDEPLDRILHKIWYGKKDKTPIFHEPEDLDNIPFDAPSGQAVDLAVPAKKRVIAEPNDAFKEHVKHHTNRLNGHSVNGSERVA